MFNLSGLFAMMAALVLVIVCLLFVGLKLAGLLLLGWWFLPVFGVLIGFLLIWGAKNG